MQGARMGQTKRDNGRLLQPSGVNSSQEHQLNPGALFPRVLEAPSVTLAPSPGALQVSGGLRHFHGTQTARHWRKGEGYVRSRSGMSSKG